MPRRVYEHRMANVVNSLKSSRSFFSRGILYSLKAAHNSGLSSTADTQPIWYVFTGGVSSREDNPVSNLYIIHNTDGGRACQSQHLGDPDREPRGICELGDGGGSPWTAALPKCG